MVSAARRRGLATTGSACQGQRTIRRRRRDTPRHPRPCSRGAVSFGLCSWSALALLSLRDILGPKRVLCKLGGIPMSRFLLGALAMGVVFVLASFASRLPVDPAVKPTGGPAW